MVSDDLKSPKASYFLGLRGMNTLFPKALCLGSSHTFAPLNAMGSTTTVLVYIWQISSELFLQSSTNCSPYTKLLSLKKKGYTCRQTYSLFIISMSDLRLDLLAAGQPINSQAEETVNLTCQLHVSSIWSRLGKLKPDFKTRTKFLLPPLP